MHFGRIGTDGQLKTKKLASPEAAKRELEELIREKVGKGYVHGAATAKGAAVKAAKAAKSATSATSAKNAGALLRLAALLAPKSAAIAKRLALAIDAPAAYAKKYDDDLEDRFAEDDPVDPWLQLVIGLTDEDAPLACSLAEAPPRPQPARARDRRGGAGRWVLTPKSGAAFLWVLDDHEMRRIAWDAILALPRVPAPPSRRG